MNEESNSQSAEDLAPVPSAGEAPEAAPERPPPARGPRRQRQDDGGGPALEVNGRRMREARGGPQRGQRSGPNSRRRRRGEDMEGGGPPRELADAEPVVLAELRAKPIDELLKLCDEKGIGYPMRPDRPQLIDLLVREMIAQALPVLADGTLELHDDGRGFLRHAEYSYAPSAEDVHIPQQLVRRAALQTGDQVEGYLRPSRGRERHTSLQEVLRVNGESISDSKALPSFESLTPLFPQSRLVLECGSGTTEDITARIIDLVAPVGKGQRGLIVSPPKAGKTIILQNIAKSIERNNPECELIVLLVDERPEEVTDMRRSVMAQVVASTFDEPAARHVQVAEIVIGYARRRVEQGKDVVILLDSITRLARAYNAVQPSSGRILTGGVDANALTRPKRFFGAARNIEGGGSLSILATALVETGSKMDEVIYEEFKGTGNLELHLERRIAEKRIFPAINLRRSSTRREEMLLSDEELQKMFILRKLLHSMDDLPAMEFLLEQLRQTKTNQEFFEAMKRG